MLSTCDKRGLPALVRVWIITPMHIANEFSPVDTFNVDVDDAHLENARAYV